MFLIAMNETPDKGAFSVINERGEKVIYMFEEHDDALRFALQLEGSGFTKVEVREYDTKQVLRTCELTNTKYTIIKPEDIVIPPVISNEL
jgi:hypothetical protein